MGAPTVIVVPGLRDAAPGHWQTLLAERLQREGRPVRCVPPIGRDELALAPRVAAIEREALAAEGPIVVVAHSGGCVTVAHWAERTQRAVHGALLAAPPDFESPLPAGYPTIEALRGAGWLPLPRRPLPFRSLVGASRDDPLARFERTEALARDWGAGLVDLGFVGHLNPASGYGEWAHAGALIAALD